MARLTGRARSSRNWRSPTPVRTMTSVRLKALAPSGLAFHHRTADRAGTAFEARVKAFKQGRKLSLDVGELEELFIQQVAAVLAVPLETVLLSRPALALDDQAHR